MTNLTEQWKKGELPEGRYYVKDGENTIAEYLDGYFYSNGLPMTSFAGGVDEVLSEVPSFEEWKVLLKENTKLKELLKEANNWLKAFYAYEQSDFVREKVKQCLTKINQALGEE